MPIFDSPSKLSFYGEIGGDQSKCGKTCCQPENACVAKAKRQIGQGQQGMVGPTRGTQRPISASSPRWLLLLQLVFPRTQNHTSATLQWRGSVWRAQFRNIHKYRLVTYDYTHADTTISTSLEMGFDPLTYDPCTRTTSLNVPNPPSLFRMSIAFAFQASHSPDCHIVALLLQ